MLYTIGAIAILTGLCGAGWAYTASHVEMAEDNLDVVVWKALTIGNGVLAAVLFLIWLAIK